MIASSPSHKKKWIADINMKAIFRSRRRMAFIGIIQWFFWDPGYGRKNEVLMYIYLLEAFLIMYV
jgi:hypothetical protein